MGLFHNLFVAVTLLAATVQQTTAIPQPTPAPELVTLNKRACSADNCLRAVRNNIQSAIPFCSTYTSDATATIPTWAANCQANPTRITSACNCLATAPLTTVYGPTDGTNYTIFSQAQNIRSRPEEWEDSLAACMGLCEASGSSCQTFSLAVMPRDFNGEPGGLTLCYFYATLFQPGLVQIATNWTRNVVYQRV